jgi:hypothetical protein
MEFGYGDGRMMITPPAEVFFSIPDEEVHEWIVLIWEEYDEIDRDFYLDTIGGE